ncbi:reverse transcriptase domain-containing protein, partial [Tanacetum coccineum]
SGANLPELEQLIADRVAAAMVAYEANRTSGSGNRTSQETSNASGGVTPLTRQCTYKEFLSCNLHDFNGNRGCNKINLLVRENGVCIDLVEFLCEKHELGDCVCNWMEGVEGDAPSHEIQNMEAELWKQSYGIQELALLCPNIVPTEKKKIERYVWGLPDDIQRNVIASKPAKIREVICMAQELNRKKVRNKAAKAVETREVGWNLHNKPMENNHKKKEPAIYHQNKRQEIVRAYATWASNKGGYDGRAPQCAKCKLLHYGNYGEKSGNCKRINHQTKDCRAPDRATITCFGCGEKGHYKHECPKGKNPGALVTVEDKKLCAKIVLLRVKGILETEN